MELCTEMKLVGDTYGSGFGCGLTLTGSATIEGFEKVGEDPSSLRYEPGAAHRKHILKETLLPVAGPEVQVIHI